MKAGIHPKDRDSANEVLQAPTRMLGHSAAPTPNLPAKRDSSRMVARRKKDPSAKDKTPAIAKGLTNLARILAQAAASESLRQQANEAKHGTENTE